MTYFQKNYIGNGKHDLVLKALTRVCDIGVFIYQFQFPRAILQKEFRILMKGMKGNVSSFTNIMMELKKCANHAHLVAPPEEEPLAREKLQVNIEFEKENYPPVILYFGFLLNFFFFNFKIFKPPKKFSCMIN